MANIITGIRIVCSIVLLFCPVFSPAFYTLYIIAGVSDQGKRKQFEKVRKEGKMIKLPTLKNASYEENYNWLWIVLGVIIGFVLTISVGGNDNASDSFSVFEFFILYLLCNIPL